MIIAIDGLAGSGKSSTAREVARRLGFLHLDSGAFYRAFAVAACRRGWADADGVVSPERIPELALQDVGAEVVSGQVAPTLEGERLGAELRSGQVTATSSRISAYREIRVRVNALLRRLAADSEVGIVCEGRDIGTAVFPDADVKFFLEAAPEERARRRLLQEGKDVSPGVVRAEAARLKARDRADSQRENSPLRKAGDARAIDTTDLGFEDQVGRIVAEVRRRLDTD